MARTCLDSSESEGNRPVIEKAISLCIIFRVSRKLWQSMLGFFLSAVPAFGQNMDGQWYGVISQYQVSDPRRVLQITGSGTSSLVCTWDEVGLSINASAKCSLKGSALELTTASNNSVRLVHSGASLVGEFTLSRGRGTFAISMSRDIPPAIAARFGTRERTKLCEQDVIYRKIAPDRDVTAGLRKYFGVWSGTAVGVNGGYNLDYQVCNGVVIEEITPSGQVAALRITGDRVKSPYTGYTNLVKPTVNPWRGKVEGSVLKLASGKHTLDLRLAGDNTLEGNYSASDQTAKVRLTRQ